MIDIEKMRIKLELARVHAGRIEMELRIAELMENVRRLEESLKVQIESEKNLEEKLK